MAKTLQVSKSGYYEWLKRKESKRKIENKKLLKKIKKIYKKSKCRYGSPRIYEVIKNKGIKCSEKRVARIMRENGIKSKIKKKCKP